MTVRVAIVGARGIGRHHGNWWTLEGAEVCAFAGQTRGSVRETEAVLTGLFGFSGKGYTDVAGMLREEEPDIVDVCSPPACHAQHVRIALEAGCHVLCEKPFVYEPGRSAKELLAETEALLGLAEARGLLLGLCTQYTVGARIFRRWWDTHREGEPVTHYHGHLEAPSGDPRQDPRRVWADLSPHLISVLLELFPDAEPVWDTLHEFFCGHEAIARFQVRTREERVDCELYTRNRAADSGHIRHFKYNGYLFDVTGVHDQDGIFRCRIDTPDGAIEEPDMMRLLIRDFLAGRPAAEGRTILDNTRLMLDILDRATDDCSPFR